MATTDQFAAAPWTAAPAQPLLRHASVTGHASSTGHASVPGHDSWQRDRAGALPLTAWPEVHGYPDYSARRAAVEAARGQCIMLRLRSTALGCTLVSDTTSVAVLSVIIDTRSGFDMGITSTMVEQLNVLVLQTLG